LAFLIGAAWVVEMGSGRWNVREWRHDDDPLWESAHETWAFDEYDDIEEQDDPET
jgi:hypothetical protein